MKAIRLVTIAVGIVGTLTIGISSSCTKEITNIYEPGLEIDTNLYPGLWSEYEANYFPSTDDWQANTNTNRNILIEDFTGHKCVFCPQAADLAEQLHQDNPGRVYVASIHSGPDGIGDFQTVTLPDYPTDFTCQEGVEIGTWFGQNDGGFPGNPRGTVSRITYNDNIMVSPTLWTQMTNDALSANDLKFNLQSQFNYFDETHGGFLHVEVEQLDAGVTSDLYIAGYILEDTLVGDQKMPDNSHNESYIHREIMRGTIDGRAFGTQLENPVTKNGKSYYYMDYSIEVPNQLDDIHNPENMHMVIYVYDAITKEIYQVIKQKFI